MSNRTKSHPSRSTAAARGTPRPPDRLAELLAELAHGEGFSSSRFPGVKFMRSTNYRPRAPVVYEPSIVIIARGRKVGHLGGERFVYDARNYLVLAMPLPFECETFGSPEEPLLGLSVGVSPALVAELVLQAGKAEKAAERPRAVECAPVDGGLHDAALRLLEALRSPADAKILGPQLVREITYRVLRGRLGGNLRALAAPHSHFGQIGRILNRMHVEFDRAISVEALARQAGMSVSTFHAHFKAVTSSSPLQYIKSIRLHKARMLMVHDGLSAGLAAHRVGYESVSQFSREFKRLFGAGPSIVAASLRQALVRLA